MTYSIRSHVAGMLGCRDRHDGLPTVGSPRPILVRRRVGSVLAALALRPNRQRLHACPKSRYAVSVIPVAVALTLCRADALSKVNRVAAYYVLATSFYAVIWCVSVRVLFVATQRHCSPHTHTRLLDRFGHSAACIAGRSTPARHLARVGDDRVHMCSSFVELLACFAGAVPSVRHGLACVISSCDPASCCLFP